MPHARRLRPARYLMRQGEVRALEAMGVGRSYSTERRCFELVLQGQRHSREAFVWLSSLARSVQVPSVSRPLGLSHLNYSALLPATAGEQGREDTLRGRLGGSGGEEEPVEPARHLLPRLPHRRRHSAQRVAAVRVAHDRGDGSDVPSAPGAADALRVLEQRGWRRVADDVAHVWHRLRTGRVEGPQRRVGGDEDAGLAAGEGGEERLPLPRLEPLRRRVRHGQALVAQPKGEELAVLPLPRDAKDEAGAARHDLGELVHPPAVDRVDGALRHQPRGERALLGVGRGHADG
mmetsp:Transcript_36950/g.110427  ORF Transcript_36950/g.110427 Transcript_36950/m.110427 type:complete len:291 (+) Transcript_36950:103-975(+)